MLAANFNTNVYTDFQGLTGLKAAAREQSPAAKREVARQFEAVFMQMMIKTMRDSVIKSDLFNPDAMSFHTSLFDQQLALHLTQANGVGLADMIYQQLGGEQTELPWSNRDEFIAYMLPAAERATQHSGLDPKSVIAVAALETGWGEKVMQRPDGSSSYNLFGIKANRNWAGETVYKNTVEFVEDVMEIRREPFRAYASVAQSIADFVNFLQQPRYAKAMQHSNDSERFFIELQRAGYATDPQYADKLIKVAQSHSIQSAVKPQPVGSITTINTAANNTGGKL